MSTKQNDKEIFTISNIETDVEDYKSLTTFTKKDSIILLIAIFGLTIIDLIIFATKSHLLVLYIPIAIVVFILLGIYNARNKTKMIVSENEIIIKNNKYFYTIPKDTIVSIEDDKESSDSILIKFDNDCFLKFATINHSTRNTLYNVLKKEVFHA